jgi:hypothetical protein
VISVAAPTQPIAYFSPDSDHAAKDLDKHDDASDKHHYAQRDPKDMESGRGVLDFRVDQPERPEDNGEQPECRPAQPISRVLLV